jgi:hypothetical protein
MDTSALTVVFVAAGVQLTLCWNFHRIYVNLYKDFKAPIDKITEKRQGIFRLNMVSLFLSSLKDYINLSPEDQKDVKKVEGAFKNPDYVEKARSLFSLVVHAEQPVQKYNQTRDHARIAYRYFMLSAMITFLGLYPALTGDAAYNFLYFIFVFSLTFAFNAWDNYYHSEKILVELRDKGE